jgi:hypothetical protein
MPADRSAGLIFRHQKLLKRVASIRGHKRAFFIPVEEIGPVAEAFRERGWFEGEQQRVFGHGLFRPWHVVVSRRVSTSRGRAPPQRRAPDGLDSGRQPDDIETGRRSFARGPIPEDPTRG